MAFDIQENVVDNQSQGESQTESAGQTQENLSPQQQQDLVDLDGVQKFKWGGQEWTPKDLQGAILRQSDYTRKTRELAEQRKEVETNKKYYDNLQADLEAVKADPALADQFRKVYPESFHKFLGYVSTQVSTPATQKPQSSAVPPEYVERLTRIESSLKEREVAAIEAEIDSVFKTMGEKYPFADETAVLARAEALARQGEKMTNQLWDELFAANHKRAEDQYKKHYSGQVQKQTAANKAGADAGRGGGTPGQKPVQARSIKEMTDQLYKSGMVS